MLSWGARFSNPNDYWDNSELKDQIIKSLRKIEQEGRAEGSEDFNKRLEAVLKETSGYSRDEPRGVVAFWGQPVRDCDLEQIESDTDAVFKNLCEVGAASMRDGYKSEMKANRLEISSEKTRFIIYDDNFRILYFSAEVASKNYALAMYYISPPIFEHIACSAFALTDSKNAWALVGILGMESRYFAEPEKGNSSSVPMYNQPSELVSKFLSPMTPASYGDWVKAQVKKFRRIFGKKS
jgi:hypothetical protein